MHINQFSCEIDKLALRINLFVILWESTGDGLTCLANISGQHFKFYCLDFAAKDCYLILL